MDCDGGDGETLTPLGAHLAALPVDARLGKFILLGAVFGAVDATLTIAATISTRSPFLSPFEKRQLADAAKRSFAIGQSDHLAVLNAYGAYDALPQTERCPLLTTRRAPPSCARPAIHRVASSRATLARYDFAREHFLGIKSLQTIGALKRQLLELLSDAGFVPGTFRACARSAARS